MTQGTTDTDADVVVVGAGPGGAAAACHLAQAGLDVIAIDKDRFPRDKVCGDGLTPRVVAELAHMGLHDAAAGKHPGFAMQRGLRIHGGSTVMELPWPDLGDWPPYGLTCTRTIFDALLVDRARSAGAQVWEGCAYVRPLWADAGESHVAGIEWRRDDQHGRIRAPLIIAADGPSSRVALSVGMARRDDRPMAVAVRTYYRSRMAEDDWISSFLDLRDASGGLLSGYGWAFPLADGTVNVGLGLLNTSREFRSTNYRDLLERWSTGLAATWDTTPEARTGETKSGPIPMGFNRTPIAHKGVMLVGDAAGMVNPFNGEGISYAMEAGMLAAEIAADFVAGRRHSLSAYDRVLRDRWGGYYTLGKWFGALMGNPAVMRLCTEYGMRSRVLMQFVFKLMAHLTDQKPSDAHDFVINMAQRIAPSA